MTPRELLSRIRLRAYAMVFASGGDGITFEQAKRAASKQIISEERAKKRSAKIQQSSSNNDGVTVSNARATLLARLNAIASRLKATAGLEESAPSTPTIRKHTLDPAGTRPRVPPNASTTENSVVPIPNKQPEPEQPPAEPVFVYGTSASVERIDDREFANSLRWGDTATDNWRKSIVRNAAIQREKEQRSRWIG
jgi:hypothetical protein